MLRISLTGLIITFVFSVLLSTKGIAQQNQLLHLNNKVYVYIKNMQLRGYLPELNPTKLPYTRGEVDKALRNLNTKKLSRVEQFWYNQIRKEAAVSQKTNIDIYVDGLLEGGFDLNNTLSSNGLRPQAEDLFFLPNGALQLYAEKDKFAGQIGLRHDLFYDQDRYGLNTLGRMYVRSEDYYIGYQGEFLQVYMGRYDNLWAPYGEISTILSDNPSSFDHINITAGNSWFQASGVFGELDNLGKDGTFERRGNNLINGTKRFLALHRIDIKILDGLRFEYFDGFVYSSQNSIASLKYINPFNVFFFERNSNPKNDEFNAFFGGSIWAHYGKATFNLQFMLDDIVIKNWKLKNDIEPSTFAVTNSLHLSGITDFMDLGYEAEVVAYQTYNTDQAEGRYLFLKRGIANQFTDYVYISGYVKFHAHTLLKGMTITPRFSYLAQGEQEINQPFVRTYPNGQTIDMLLSGTEERTSRVSMDLLYNPMPEFWVNAAVGYNYLTDKGHILGRTGSRLTARLEVGFRVNLDSYIFK